jgi:DNA-directed RNA polymerase subunit RPC12/RpoP
MKNYLCGRCKEVVQSERVPLNSNNCLNRKFHDWRDIGEVGNDIYKCSKCGTKVCSKRQPLNGNSCIDGQWHNWSLLQKSREETTDQKQEPTIVSRNLVREREYDRQISRNRDDDEIERRRLHEEYQREQEERDQEREQKYQEWLQNQPCVFCREQLNPYINVIEYRDFIAHEHCLSEYLETPAGQAYLAKIRKEKEENERIAETERKRWEEEKKKKQEEEQKRIENEQREAAKWAREFAGKRKFRILLRFVIIPFSLVLFFEFIQIRIFPFPVNSIGICISLIIEYIIFLIVSFVIENKFDIDWYPDSNIIKTIIINLIGFLIIFFIARLLFAQYS